MGRGREIGQNSADVWRVGFYLRAGILGMGTCETRSFIRIYLRGGGGCPPQTSAPCTLVPLYQQRAYRTEISIAITHSSCFPSAGTSFCARDAVLRARDSGAFHVNNAGEGESTAPL